MAAVAVPAAICLVAAALAGMAAWQLRPPVATSAWLMPLIVMTAMTAVSAWIAVAELVKRSFSADRDSHGFPASTTPLRVAGWLGLSFGYAALTPFVGFEWATGVFLLVALIIFGKADWRLAALVAISMAFLIPLIFRNVFFTLVP